MHGYSDAVRTYSMHSRKPKNPSGTRKARSDEPAWITPNTRPVMIAAGHMPRHERSAVKKYPRKKNSSDSGAITQTSRATQTSATVLSSAPSSLGSLSSPPWTPSSATKTAVNRKNETQAATPQPTAGHSRVGPQAEVGRPRPAAEARHEHGRADQAQILHDRREDVDDGARRVERAAEGHRREPEHDRPADRRGEPGHQRDPRRPGLPVRSERRQRDALRQLRTLEGRGRMRRRGRGEAGRSRGHRA